MKIQPLFSFDPVLGDRISGYQNDVDSVPIIANGGMM